MARPPKPLISRAAAVAGAIAIIDSEGLEAFSLPRPAQHLDVRAPSSNQLTPRQPHEQMVRSFLHGVVRDDEERTAPATDD